MSWNGDTRSEISTSTFKSMINFLFIIIMRSARYWTFVTNIMIWFLMSFKVAAIELGLVYFGFLRIYDEKEGSWNLFKSHVQTDTAAMIDKMK